MLQIEFFNRLDPITRDNHIDDTFIKVGPIDNFQWTYSHLRLWVHGAKSTDFDIVRYGKESVMYRGMLFGDFRIVPYDPTDDSVEELTESDLNQELKYPNMKDLKLVLREEISDTDILNNICKDTTAILLDDDNCWIEISDEGFFVPDGWNGTTTTDIAIAKKALIKFKIDNEIFG